MWTYFGLGWKACFGFTGYHDIFLVTVFIHMVSARVLRPSEAKDVNAPASVLLST